MCPLSCCTTSSTKLTTWRPRSFYMLYALLREGWCTLCASVWRQLIEPSVTTSQRLGALLLACAVFAVTRDLYRATDDAEPEDVDYASDDEEEELPASARKGYTRGANRSKRHFVELSPFPSSTLPKELVNEIIHSRCLRQCRSQARHVFVQEGQDGSGDIACRYTAEETGPYRGTHRRQCSRAHPADPDSGGDPDTVWEASVSLRSMRAGLDLNHAIVVCCQNGRLSGPIAGVFCVGHVYGQRGPGAPGRGRRLQYIVHRVFQVCAEWKGDGVGCACSRTCGPCRVQVQAAV